MAVEIVKRHKLRRTRPKGFVLRLTAEEHEELRDAATDAVLPLVTWARQVLLLAAKAQRKRLRGIVSAGAELTHPVNKSADDVELDAPPPPASQPRAVGT